jgi:sulfide:quinone oxidoreductase
MQRIVILGAGTGGTMVAHKLTREIGGNADITIIDRDPIHHYQPGFLFIPFGIYKAGDVIRPKDVLLPAGVHYIVSDIERVDPQQQRVHLSSGHILDYDALVIATGTDIEPGETPGLLDGGWRETIFDFYSLNGAMALHEALNKFEGGRIVVNVSEMPIKCPVAPLEFLFLLDWHLHERGIRQKAELVFATPLPGAFTKPTCNTILSHTLVEKGIAVESEFNIAEVDGNAQAIRSYDDREIPFDLLVTIPINMGAEMIERSGLGDELRYVPTHHNTMQSKQFENIFVIGDAANVPASKAGSVAHFQLDTVVGNLLRFLRNQPLEGTFDGHANCFIESGFGKAYLIDFNYETQPLQGSFPMPGIGPFKLLEETRLNHFGKLAFRWIYWNILLKGRPMPMVSDQMQMAGKIPALN